MAWRYSESNSKLFWISYWISQFPVPLIEDGIKFELVQICLFNYRAVHAPCRCRPTYDLSQHIRCINSCTTIPLLFIYSSLLSCKFASMWAIGFWPSRMNHAAIKGPTMHRCSICPIKSNSCKAFFFYHALYYLTIIPVYYITQASHSMQDRTNIYLVFQLPCIAFLLHDNWINVLLQATTFPKNRRLLQHICFEFSSIVEMFRVFINTGLMSSWFYFLASSSIPLKVCLADHRCQLLPCCLKVNFLYCF